MKNHGLRKFNKLCKTYGLLACLITGVANVANADHSLSHSRIRLLTPDFLSGPTKDVHKRPDIACRLNNYADSKSYNLLQSALSGPDEDGNLPSDYHDALIMESGVDLELCSGDRVTKQFLFRGDVSDVTVNCNGATIGWERGMKPHRHKSHPDYFTDLEINSAHNKISYPAEMFRFKDIILIESELVNGEWKRPRNITINDCNIIGSARVLGLGPNGEGELVRESSWNRNHTQFARSVAPTNITFNKVKISAHRRTPFYLAPGVTNVTLKDSVLDGHTSKSAIYLDTESAGNIIENNDIRVFTKEDSQASKIFNVDRGWPQIAIDGSSVNQILNNRFTNTNNGGIYLYRNCGEKRTIRHSGPSGNRIINNIFEYSNDGAYDDPAIFIGSRDYGWKQSKVPFTTCDEDRIGIYQLGDIGRKGTIYENLTMEDVPRINSYGSARSNKDYARRNVVMQNQFFSRKENIGGTVIDSTMKQYIRIKNKKINSGSIIIDNEIVADNTVNTRREAGCYNKKYKNGLIPHNTIYDKAIKFNNTVYTVKYQCNNGRIENLHAGLDYNVRTIPIGCQVEGNNAGCERYYQCPIGTKIVGTIAACNLEYGSVSQNDVDRTVMNYINIVTPSDKVKSGQCYVGKDNIASNFYSPIEYLFGFR